MLTSPLLIASPMRSNTWKRANPIRRLTPRLRVGDVIGRLPAHWGYAVWDLSRWDDNTGGVEIASEQGDDLLDVVRRAADFLRTKF
jgi:hypothetical protein